MLLVEICRSGINWTAHFIPFHTLHVGAPPDVTRDWLMICGSSFEVPTSEQRI